MCWQADEGAVGEEELEEQGPKEQVFADGDDGECGSAGWSADAVSGRMHCNPCEARQGEAKQGEGDSSRDRPG